MTSMFQPVCLALPRGASSKEHPEQFLSDPDVLGGIITHIGTALSVLTCLGSLHESARSKQCVDDFPVLRESAVVSFLKGI